MLNVTRTWNSVSAVALMRRGLALARDYAKRRIAFGAPLAEKPLHLDTLAGLQAEFEAAFHLTFFVVELLGRAEAEQASAQQNELLRMLTPIAKLTTGRQVGRGAVGSDRSVRRRGLRRRHGSAAAAARRAGAADLGRHDERARARCAARAAGPGGLAALKREAHYVLQGARHPELIRLSARVEHVLEETEAWLAESMQAAPATLEAGARRFALTVGRTFALALLLRQAQWSLDHERDARPLAAARRFAAAGVNLLADMDANDARMLGRDEN